MRVLFELKFSRISFESYFSSGHCIRSKKILEEFIYIECKKKLLLNHKELNIKNFKNYYLIIDVATKMLTYSTLYIYYPIKIANDITWESVFYAITRLIWNLGNLRILKSNYLVKIVELEGRTDRKFLYRIRCWPNCRSPCISCLPQFLDPYYYPLTR